MERAGRKKTLETRDRILDAAEDVFNESGYSNTTLNEIAEAAGVTRGAIYWHFKNKEDLFQAMCLRIRVPMDALIEGIVEKGVNDPIAQLSRTHETIMLEVINNPHYRKVLNILFHKCEFTRETDQIVIQQKEWHTYSRNIIRTILVNAQKKAQLPADLDIELACNLLGFMFRGLLADWLFMPDSFDLIENARKVNDAVFELMRTSVHLKK
ncbi:TetR family transcriptional regulator [Oxalobacter sp. OxGP1]|uniref:TetR family transcriptional regulator n=1 Tax=Oxalobacter paeniformigenes TaxID=2946594 RepID=UPI0022AEE851|nr:TetR family transcriptional regulator [Oxalobacter paeniformigenes]MCZ4053313.1 TetR family transcriptional regulator [Oxalobacter paeniformigenes]